MTLADPHGEQVVHRVSTGLEIRCIRHIPIEDGLEGRARLHIHARHADAIGGVRIQRSNCADVDDCLRHIIRARIDLDPMRHARARVKIEQDGRVTIFQ